VPKLGMNNRNHHRFRTETSKLDRDLRYCFMYTVTYKEIVPGDHNRPRLVPLISVVNSCFEKDPRLETIVSRSQPTTDSIPLIQKSEVDQTLS
jgi:hypothetical protein